MPTRLNSTDPDFHHKLETFLALRHQSDDGVSETVRAIIADVRARGDAALCDYTSRFDKREMTPEKLRLSDAEIDEAMHRCPKEVISALMIAAERIRSYHEQQRPHDSFYQDDIGTELGWQWRAIHDVGIYVPGGLASYPSSVLMNAIPAHVAGCERIAMVVPAPSDELNPAVLAAANIAGIREIHTVGGAQAIAALAYGTESIKPVQKIVGPGNAYVAEAKRQLFGQVGIDMIAGPSEILVIADDKNNPDWIAADLLSQAEHDPIAQSVLICDNADFAEAVIAAVEKTLSTLEREAIARPSWEHYGAVIIVPTFDHAVSIIDEIAPEHLELAIDEPHALAGRIRNAGAIFLGRHTPEAIGDYIAGPSHVLPTSRSARFSSGLSVYDFLKKTSLIGCSVESVQKIGPKAHDLALSEGLDAHALSLSYRIAQK